MDSEDLSPALLKAGQEYLESLRRLRLNPEGLLWARVNDINLASGAEEILMGRPGDWHLVLVTSAIDEGGPSAINELLFKAYDASATPKEISPFIVEVMSAKAPFVSSLVSALNNPFGADARTYMLDGRELREFTQPIDSFSGQMMVGGLWFDRKWIYHLAGLRDRYIDRKRHWREFKQSVNALAA